MWRPIVAKLSLRPTPFVGRKSTTASHSVQFAGFPRGAEAAPGEIADSESAESLGICHLCGLGTFLDCPSYTSVTDTLPTGPHTYESLAVGDSFTWTRRLTMDDVEAFADITGDDNPIHIDEEAGRQSRFGRPVVHGVYILGLASKVLGRDFPGPGSIAVTLSAKFLRPVPVGEEVTIEVRVAEKNDERKHVKIKLYAYCNGKMAVGGEATVIPPSADHGA